MTVIDMYRIGFDIGGTNIAFGMIDDELNIIRKSSVPFPHTEANEVAKLIASLCNRLCDETGIETTEIELIGICIPGSIDASREKVIDAYNLSFHDVPFKKMVEDETGRKVQLMNDADAATLAEYKIGSLRGMHDSMLITIGTGIGGGIILNGKLFPGGHGNGVELGHVQMYVHGELCTCGRRGCIETLCSATWLNRQALSLYENGNRFLNSLARSEIDGKALIDGAKAGDSECLSVWNQYLDNLSDALASYTNIIDPECIAIGGGVSNAGDFLIKPVEKLTQQKCFFKTNPPKVVRALLGNDAGLIGSVIID